MIIYKVTNIINNKSYIGQTQFSLEQRKRSHIIEGRNDNLYFHNALKKYGDEKFNWSVIESCENKEELDEMEFHYIKQYNTISPNGYNLTYGGEGSHGRKLSNETIEKIRKSLKGKKRSKESIEKQSKAQLGRIPWNKGLSKESNISLMVISEKTKSNHNSGKIKCYLSNRKGVKLTEEHKQKIRLNQIGENNSFYGKKHDQEIIKNTMSHFGEDNPASKNYNGKFKNV